MDKPYSQSRATFAIMKASFRAIAKSPQAVFFSLFFPIVLLIIFGSLGRGGGPSFDIAFEKNSDTANVIYQNISRAPILNIVKGGPADIEDRLKKGRIAAILQITKTDSAKYDLHVKSSSANQNQLPQLYMVLKGMVNEISQQIRPVEKIATISSEQVTGRLYKRIDFYLPGMIGFSLIGSAIFGVAFVFFALRETLVLKSMYASPVYKRNIVIGESLGRGIYQIIIVIILVLFGKFFYGFTLANGFTTFFEILVITILALVVFMGFGFLISSLAKNQNVIPIYANLFMFPQYFLSGTFFPKTALPQGIQWLVEILPLTALNDALRKVSFEGSHITDTWKELGILAIWGVIIYAVAIKVFRWE